ncbi:hypothetical protein LTR70_009239 [Exophiala xenobiotica]|uniref:Uncharacterized protein n=1 Tax=Lithohypha guttulata TaxID=1690604 RepID=A0ABR0K192_9EURO|nr:hypothetical protein LTR24_008047 [Lithohypha guttulata]KAK5310744.1 hypothetical protein LTR70_009239 [Exophiala xenobiotica]
MEGRQRVSSDWNLTTITYESEVLCANHLAVIPTLSTATPYNHIWPATQQHWQCDDHRRKRQKVNDDRWYECSTACHPVPQEHGIDHGTTITETTSPQIDWSASYAQHDSLKGLIVSQTIGSVDTFSQPQPESQSFAHGRSEQPTAVRSSVESAQYRQHQHFAIPTVPCDVGGIHDEEEQKGDRGDDTEDTEEDIVCYGLLYNLDHMQLDFKPSADQELLWNSRAGCISTRDKAVRPTQRVATILVSLSDEAGTTFDLKLDYSQDDESRTYKPRQSKDESNTTTYALSVVLYGPRSALDVVGDWLDYIGLYLQTPSYCTKDVPYCNPHRMTQPNARVIMTSQLSGSLEQIRLDSCDSASTDLSEIYTTRIYKHAPQPQRLRTILHDHQRQALSFMQGRERGWDLQDERGTNDLWQCKHDYLGHEYFVDILSGQRSSQRPPDFCGGILADDMGLGKTCSMLSLIATDDHCSDFGDATEVTVPDATPRTTIVMPLPLLQMWEKQIELHLVPGKTRSTTYYGQSRHLIDSFAAYDIVITTYDTVAGEWKAVQARSANKSPSPLLATHWHRVVLDEAYIIKNRNTNISKAVSALNGKRRWCITGTPIQNRSSDLYSLLRFLKLCPYDNFRNFERLFVEPWKDSLASAGLHNLQSLFRAIAIRRPKATITLATRHEVTQKVQFSAEENGIYETTKRGVVDLVNTAVAQSHMDGGRSYFNTLQRINDLRYICNHGTIPAKRTSNRETPTAGRAKRSIQAQADVLLGAGDIETCEVCGNELLEEQESEEDFLRAGDTPSSTTEARLCPTCDVRSLSPFTSASVTGGSNTSNPGSSIHLSSKVQSLVQAIQQVPSREKCVVFSYWTSSLELVRRALSSACITFTRYFGSMPRKKRDNILDEFANNIYPRVILVSISCGGTGLDLTAANHAFLLEPQWNPVLEEQALARVHRIGQKRPVRLVRLIMKDTHLGGEDHRAARSKASTGQAHRRWGESEQR